jgi:hypothetical protein
VTGLDELTIFIMNVLTVLARAGVAIVVEQCFQLIDVVGSQSEMVAFAKLALGGQTGHLRPVVAVKTVPTHHGRLKSFAGEQPAEDTTCGGRSRTGGAGNRNDRVAFRHDARASGSSIEGISRGHQSRLLSNLGFSITKP